jgi:hypothetical protein
MSVAACGVTIPTTGRKAMARMRIARLPRAGTWWAARLRLDAEDAHKRRFYDRETQGSWLTQ